MRLLKKIAGYFRSQQGLRPSLMAISIYMLLALVALAQDIIYPGI